jgi:hypothetical protein
MNLRIYNNTLNPELWTSENTLYPNIRNALLKIAYDFYADVKLTVPVEDVYILGSSANYNWSEMSDIDLHVLIDFKKINPDTNLDKQLVDALKSNWNKNHNITIKNRKVELYIQDISENNRSTGVYSVLKNTWIKVPNQAKIVLDTKLIQQKYNNLVLQINNAIHSNDLVLLKNVLKVVYNIREVGLSSTGEYSVENIVFKILRSRGYLDLLKTKITALYDTSVSVPQ